MMSTLNNNNFFSTSRIPWYMVLVPFLWSLIGLLAATNLHIREDFGLVVAGTVATVISLLYKSKNLTRPVS